MKTKFIVDCFDMNGYSHSYDEIWESLPMVHCPSCGSQGTVWHEDGPGDYYVGELHICAACDSKWYMPDGVGKVTDEDDLQRLDAISAADRGDAPKQEKPATTTVGILSYDLNDPETTMVLSSVVQREAGNHSVVAVKLRANSENGYKDNYLAVCVEVGRIPLDPCRTAISLRKEYGVLLDNVWVNEDYLYELRDKAVALVTAARKPSIPSGG